MSQDVVDSQRSHWPRNLQGDKSRGGPIAWTACGCTQVAQNVKFAVSVVLTRYANLVSFAFGLNNSCEAISTTYSLFEIVLLHRANIRECRDDYRATKFVTCLDRVLEMRGAGENHEIVYGPTSSPIGGTWRFPTSLRNGTNCTLQASPGPR